MKLLALAVLVFLPLFARGYIVMPQAAKRALREARNQYAAAHGRPASNERFDWKELTP